MSNTTNIFAALVTPTSGHKNAVGELASSAKPTHEKRGGFASELARQTTEPTNTAPAGETAVHDRGAPAGSSEPDPTTERRPDHAAEGDTPVADPAVPATPPADHASADGATPATPPDVATPTTSVTAAGGTSAAPGTPLGIAQSVVAEQALLMANANANPQPLRTGDTSQSPATTNPALLLQNRAVPQAQGPGAAPNAAAHLATTGLTGLDLSVTRRPDWVGTPHQQATTAAGTTPLIPAQPAVAAQVAGTGQANPSGLPLNNPALTAPDGNADILPDGDDNLRQIALRAQINDFAAKPTPAATAANTTAATAILSAGANGDGAAGSGAQVGTPSLASAVLASIQAETGDAGGQTGQHGGTKQTPLPITETPIILADGTAAGPAGPGSNALGELLGTQRADVASAGRPAPLPNAVTEQVAIQIASAARSGMRHITMQMRPATLGQVDVELSIGRDGQVRALVLAERSDTLELLQRDARSLERALQDAGLKSDSGSLSFGLRGEGQGGDRDSGHSYGSAAIASAIDDESEAATAAQLAYAQPGADGHALDIRV